MSDFSPEFRAALSKEIDRMGTTLAAACALRDQIDGADGEGDSDLPSVASFVAAAKQASKPPRAKALKRSQRAAISPEQLASRQIQGRYLGLIRQIPKRARGPFQTLAREFGRDKAIRAMQQELRRQRSGSKAKRAAGYEKAKTAAKAKATKPAKARRRSKPAPATTNESSSSPAES